MPTTATSTMEAIGVRVRVLTRPSSDDAGSILSRDSANASLVATTMLASTQEKIARNTTTCRTSAGDWRRSGSGRCRPAGSSAGRAGWPVPCGIAMRNPTIMNRLAATDT